MMLSELEDKVYSFVHAADICPVIYPNSSVDVVDSDHARVYLNYLYNDKNNLCGVSTVSYWNLKINIFTRKNVGTGVAAEYVDKFKVLLPQMLAISDEIIVNKAIVLHPFISDSDGWYCSPTDIGLKINER